jgi:septum formation protein
MNSDKVNTIILASKSPRRQEILTQMGISFVVKTKDVEESFPPNLNPEEVAVYIAEKKAKAFISELDDELLITSDTIVCLGNEIIGKPKDEKDAFRILTKLSGQMHKVITAVTFLQNGEVDSFYDTTEVYFEVLSPSEIHYYIKNYKPFDKAGAYGIQEWIGYIGIKKIIGSYTNVMGLPSEIVYKRLKERIELGV